MADIHAQRAHNLPLDEAKSIAHKLAEKVLDDFQLEGQWQGNTLIFNSSGVEGSLDVNERNICLEVSLGLMFKPFKSRIQEKVNKNMDAFFA